MASELATKSGKKEKGTEGAKNLWIRKIYQMKSDSAIKLDITTPNIRYYQPTKN